MNLSAILLAGERPGDSPVARAAGVACKALAPVAGRPMLARVLGTLRACAGVADCQIVGNPQLRPALDPVMAEFSGFASWRDGAATPAASAALAAAALPPERAFLLTSADHPLLSVAMIEALCDHPAARDHDIVAGLVRHAAVRARYPDARCTALRFADDHYCGTNLYLFRTARARRVITAWQSVEAARKSPWRVIRILGPVAVLAYVTGRLSLPRALAILSRRFGVAAAAALLDDPRAALDVDTAADWQFACRLLAEPGAVQS